MDERPTHPKSTCCIMGCPRWSRKYAPGTSWICYPHWRSVPLRCRRAIDKTDAIMTALRARYDAGGWTLELSRAWSRGEARFDRLWAHALRIATMRAAGL